MKAFLKHVMISAVVFTNLFLIVATPIPKPFTASDLNSRVLPAELFDDGVPTTAARIIALPDVVDIEDGPSLLARAPSEGSEGSSSTGPLITIPKEFLQVPPDSAPVTLRVPRVLEYTSLRSVLHILDLMNVAVDKCDALKVPRDTFLEELQKIKIPSFKSLDNLTWRINQNRFPESEEEDLQVLDLETLKHRITDAVKTESMFQGEILIAAAFFPGGQRIGLKVPYPDNADAVQSVDAILYLLHSGISREQAKHLGSLCSQLKVRLKTDFKLDLGDRPPQKIGSLTPEERKAFEMQFIRVVGLHNNAKWISRDIPETCSATMMIPQIFLPAKSGDSNPSRRTLRIPSSNDKGGVDSLNNLLQLMAKVAGPDTIRKNIDYVYKRLTTAFKLENIIFPDKWGTDAMTNEERGDQQSLVATWIKKHNEAVEEWNEESYRNVCKGIGHRKRKADGSPEHNETLPAARQKQEGGESGNKSAGERLSHDNQVGPGTGTTGSHLERSMAPMAPGPNDQSHRITLPGIRTAVGEQLDGTVHPEQLEGTNHRPTFPGVLRLPPNNQRGDSETTSQRGPS
ncbi:hypothetical protein H0H93_010266 [Arthromyces matolae]|nr:hypothetical protein H0H93_010266 [Arthromyces matolae]